MADGESNPRVPLGPVGQYVLRNLKRVREDHGLTYVQLAERLKLIGRPIPTLGLSRIENGNRRVDVDDLVALAIVLEVSPATLLLPPDPGGPDDEVELTAELRLSGYAARQWAAGKAPLPTADAISWPRPAFHIRMREAEMEEMRARLSALELHIKIRDERNRHHQEDELAADDLLAVRPFPAEEGKDRPVVAAIVTSGLGVLVSRRNDGKPPWGFITGKIEVDESPTDAAIREVKEETGLEVRAGRVIGERNPHPVTRKHMIYMAATPTEGTDVFVGDSDELAEVRWVSLAEADELLPGMYPPVHEHLERELGGQAPQ